MHCKRKCHVFMMPVIVYWARQAPRALTAFSAHCNEASAYIKVMKVGSDTRWVSVVEFNDQALSISKVFGQESTVVKWNYQIFSLHLVTVHQKVPILDFQSEFSMSKIIRIFPKKKFIEEYQFRRTFFVKSIFCWLQFLNHFITKMTPNFWRTVTWWRPKIW